MAVMIGLLHGWLNGAGIAEAEREALCLAGIASAIFVVVSIAAAFVIPFQAVAADITKSKDCAAMVEAARDRHRQPRLGRGRDGGELAPGDAGERGDDVPGRQARDPRDGEGRRRRDRERLIDLRAAPRGLTVYSASKGAVIALTRAMAVDHGKDGIRVNCVAPGPVYTPMVYQRGMSTQQRDRRRQASVMGREGTGWDIGHAVRFLLSDYARYITGHTLVVDGGATLVGPERDAPGA